MGGHTHCHPQLWLRRLLARGRGWRESLLRLALVLLQADLLEWLCALGLPQYHKKLLSSGYDSMGLVADLTWEELQEIGVNKLGEPGCTGASGQAPTCRPGSSKRFQSPGPEERTGLERHWGDPLQPH